MTPRRARTLAVGLMITIDLVAMHAGAASAAAAGAVDSTQLPVARGASAGVTPGVVRLGEPVIYRGWVVYPWMPSVQWLPPEPNPAFTWGRLRPRILRGRPPARVGQAAHLPNHIPIDTLYVEASLQVFQTGDVTIPGLRIREQDGYRPNLTHDYRIPAVNLVVIPVLTAADSNAQLRPARGPIEAPWWERIAWSRVGFAAVALAAVIAALVWWRRKPAALPAAAAAGLDPVAQALEELAALRRLDLPAQSRYAEHALQLSRIARRFLEATAGTPRPGDSTPELLAHLEAAALDPEDFARLSPLLRLWDRVKFARAPSSSEEATRAEASVEALVRRRAPEPKAEVA